MIILIAILIFWGIAELFDGDWLWGGILIVFGCSIGWNQIKDPTLQEQKKQCEQAGFFWEESGKLVLEGDEYVADGKCVKDIP